MAYNKRHILLRGWQRRHRGLQVIYRTAKAPDGLHVQFFHCTGQPELVIEPRVGTFMPRDGKESISEEQNKRIKERLVFAHKVIELDVSFVRLIVCLFKPHDG